MLVLWVQTLVCIQLCRVAIRRLEHASVICVSQPGAAPGTHMAAAGTHMAAADQLCFLFSPSLELRVPFLDHRFSSYYLSLPPEMRIPKVSKSALDKNPKRCGLCWWRRWPSFVFLSEWDRKASPERDVWGLQPAAQRDSLETKRSLQWWDHLSQELLVQDLTGLCWTSGLSLKILSGTIKFNRDLGSLFGI